MIIGLTGGIGSGKSTAAKLFADKGIDVVDCDIISHELVAPAQTAFGVIIDHFGSQLITETGKLDRKQLAQIIFEDAEEKAWLENLLHPLIFQEVHRRARQARSIYTLVVIPLLAETQQDYALSRVVVVDCEPSLQLQRTMARDHYDTTFIKAIMTQQASREERLALADDVIDNNADLHQLKEQVDTLHQAYRLRYESAKLDTKI